MHFTSYLKNVLFTFYIAVFYYLMYCTENKIKTWIVLEKVLNPTLQLRWFSKTKTRNCFSADYIFILAPCVWDLNSGVLQL